MLPAFHRERVAASLDTMVAETERALGGLAPGRELDLYAWTRHLALRVAMRALFGFDPDRSERDFDAAEEFERALSFYGRDYLLQILRGPGSPWARLGAARRRLDRLIFERDRASPGVRPPRRGHHGPAARRDRRGGRRSSGRAIRDQVMTLLFAGHDTTTSTVSFLIYELARAPDAVGRLVREPASTWSGACRPPRSLTGGCRSSGWRWTRPCASIRPRGSAPAARPRSSCSAVTVPAGLPVSYCSWASHRLADVFPEPDRSCRSASPRGARAKLPKGAYVPFGGGSRICIGMRFGVLEIRAIAARLLRASASSFGPAGRCEIRQMPTLSPRAACR